MGLHLIDDMRTLLTWYYDFLFLAWLPGHAAVVQGDGIAILSMYTLLGCHKVAILRQASFRVANWCLGGCSLL